MYVAIIGDIIGSKSLMHRKEIQIQLNQILAQVNRKFSDDIHSNFLITLGDEFQGLLYNPHNVVKIIEFIQLNFYPNRIRFGIGIGTIDTDFIRSEALGADGPVYHKARKMVEDLKISEDSFKKQNVFIKLSWGVDEDMERLINSSFNACSFIEQQWTVKQREVIYKILMGKNIQYIATEANLAPSSIYRRLNRSGYYDYVNIRNSIITVLDNKWSEHT